MPTDPLDAGTTTTERLQIYQEIVCRSLVSLAVDVSTPDRFQGSVACHRIGPLTLTDVVSQPQEVRRTPRLIGADGNRYLKVGMLLRGRCVMSQHGREAAMTAGDLVCYDSASPYAFHMQTPFRLAVLMLPAAIAEHRLAGFDLLTSVTIGGDRGLGAVTAGVLRSVLADASSCEGPAENDIGAAVTDVVAGLVAQYAGRPPDQDAARAAQLARARRHIETHLPETDLTPATVAAAIGISLRYLYTLFQLDGITVSAWIRTRRLDQVVRDLGDPRLRQRPVAVIGARWGFADPAHFSRTFRLREGVGPREFREQAVRAREVKDPFTPSTVGPRVGPETAAR